MSPPPVIAGAASAAMAALALAAAPPGAAGASGWRSPVPGPDVARPFVLGANPYAPGRHRGADLAAPRGAPVRAACSGRVTFAGRVPRGPTVSIRCGRLVATHQHLASLRVRRGVRVRAGVVIGRVGDPGGGRPHVHLGARVAATGRYVDPMALIADTGLGPAPPPALTPRRPRSRSPAWQPAPVPRAVPAPVPSPAPPWTAWAGLLLLAPAIGLGGLLRRRGRGHPGALGEVARAHR